MKTLFHLASILSYAIVLLAFAPAHAQTPDPRFGKQTIGAQTSSGASANFARGSKFTLTENGEVYYFCGYLDGLGGGTGNQDFQFVVYRDNHGVPGEQVIATNPQQVGAGDRAQWVCIAMPFMPLAAGDYWLVIHTGGNPNVIRYYFDGSTGWYGGADAFADGPANPFGSGGPGAGAISIYAIYTTHLHSAGRTSIASSRSSGMSSDFKRATRFTMAESGVLQGMNVYLDGFGGVSGQQQIDMGLYRDANGVPGELLAQGTTGWVSAGQTGLWRITPYFSSDVKLTPGQYWIGLLSAGPSGVARYAVDGTGSTWYGNADAYADGFSSPFGAGNPGTGTMSAYVNYYPGTFTQGTLGRTDVATPLKGLSANFIRGSRFEAVDNGNIKIANALYAYLDGKGGASGSQTVRMVLYYSSVDDGAIIPIKNAESAPITIAAGTPPGWVRFPIPPTSIAAGVERGYYIAIQSGDKGGVIRSYGDGPANWRGNDDSFADGANYEFTGPNASEGSVTLSVYATFDELHASTSGSSPP